MDEQVVERDIRLSLSDKTYGFNIDTVIHTKMAKNKRGNVKKTMTKTNQVRGEGSGNANNSKKQDERPSAAGVMFNGINNGNINITGANGTKEDVEREHREEMEMVGRVSSIKGEELLLRSYVNQSLWKKKKFIATSREFDYKSPVCLKILLDLGVGKQDRKEFWRRNHRKIYQYLSIKRNNVVTSMKLNFMSKYIR